MGWRGGSIGGNVDAEKIDRILPDRVLLFRLLKYFVIHRKYFIIVFISSVITSSSYIIGPIIIGYSVDNYVFPMNSIGTDYSGLMLTVALFLLVQIVNYVAEYSQVYFMSKTSQSVIYDIRASTFDKLQRLSHDYFSKYHTGSIISRLTNDVEILNDFLTYQFPVLFVGVLSLFGSFGVMATINIKLTLAAMVMFPFFSLLVLLLQKRIQISWMKARIAMSLTTGYIAESISGMRIIQSFAVEKDNENDFEDVNHDNLTSNIVAAKFTSMIFPGTQFSQSIGIASIFMVGGLMITSGDIGIGTIVTFYMWLNNLFRPLQQLMGSYSQYESSMTGLDRLFQIQDENITVLDNPPSNSNEVLSGNIEFRDLSFEYVEDTPVLDNINLKINSKEILAIVGHTGAGKTSLVNLLYRFYEPQTGDILIDGVNINTMSFSDYRSKMAYVSQDHFLFADTIIENIRYGDLNATRDEIISVCNNLGINDFIESLPHKYDTVLTEDATNLSSGQRQLISLARALLADPMVLILDEATSRIDPYNEVLIQSAIDKVLHGRTSIVIAHRLSTIRLADRIIVMNDGKIVEEGNHDSLLKQKGLYSNIYMKQFATYDSE